MILANIVACLSSFMQVSGREMNSSQEVLLNGLIHTIYTLAIHFHRQDVTN